MKCQYDGKSTAYYFGLDSYHGGATQPKHITADSLAKAVRVFRVGVLFPHQYTDKDHRVKSQVLSARGYLEDTYLESLPGGYIPVSVIVDGRHVEIAQIPPEGDEAEDFSIGMLPNSIQQTTERALSGSTDLAPVRNQTLAGITQAKRSEIEAKQLELARKQGELELQKRELESQVAVLNAEVKKRLENIWIIELFLGSHEEILQLSTGTPASATEPITIYQQTLCMDEECALWDWLHNPEKIGQFDYRTIEAFDSWVTSDSAHLNQVLPAQKGIVALRIRRKEKDRGYNEDPAERYFKAQEAEEDKKTYLLIRNGECLYRIWTDVKLWPRFFQQTEEFDFLHQEKTVWGSDKKNAENQLKQYIGGLIAVQGLLERSPVFHPLPCPKIDVFNPEHVDLYFRLVRNDEGNKILPGSALDSITWKSYREWLQSKLGEGQRVLWIGTPDYRHSSDRHHPLYGRTGNKRIDRWPSSGDLHTLESGFKSYPYTFDFAFKYNPEPQYRKNRLTFGAYDSEVLPFDLLSWRVIEHLLKNRSQREFYVDFFQPMFHWHQLKKTETEAERPFIDLVLSQNGVNPLDPNSEPERARAERLVRWWKLKVQEHRTIGTDEAKALRMIGKAFKSGQDHDEDPEKALFADWRIQE